MNFELDDLDQRAVGKALVERMGRLLEIVGDTTRTAASRRAASREMRVIASVLGKLERAGPDNQQLPMSCVVIDDAAVLERR